MKPVISLLHALALITLPVLLLGQQVIKGPPFKLCVKRSDKNRPCAVVGLDKKCPNECDKNIKFFESPTPAPTCPICYEGFQKRMDLSSAFPNGFSFKGIVEFNGNLAYNWNPGETDKNTITFPLDLPCSKDMKIRGWQMDMLITSGITDLEYKQLTIVDWENQVIQAFPPSANVPKDSWWRETNGFLDASLSIDCYDTEPIYVVIELSNKPPARLLTEGAERELAPTTFASFFIKNFAVLYE